MNSHPIPLVDLHKCTRCGTCIEVCQVNAISIIRSQFCSRCIKYCLTMEVPCHSDQLVFDYGLCTGCGDCQLKCLEGAIRLTNQ